MRVTEGKKILNFYPNTSNNHEATLAKPLTLLQMIAMMFTRTFVHREFAIQETKLVK